MNVAAAEARRVRRVPPPQPRYLNREDGAGEPLTAIPRTSTKEISWFKA